MYRPKRWNLAPRSERAEELSAQLKTSPLIAQILLNRDLSQIEECQQFLSPSLKLLPDPSQLPNLLNAAERLARAVRDRQKIVIYGDYDVDGITGTAILWHAIRLLGGTAEYYIPHRVEEGYGLNAEAMQQICDGGAQLIITVDCGITGFEEARIARERGVDLIVTDHHEFRAGAEAGAGPLLPDCYAVVHPRLRPAGDAPAYPNPHLCGAGVAFKLAWGLGQAFDGATRVNTEFRRFLVEATGLAALGTIADVVPLKGENRLLAHFGLKGLMRSEMTGIQALIESAGLRGKKLDAYHAGFLLAPRLNACGRMGHARRAVELLTRADAAQAKEIATYLDEQNRARQALEKQIFVQAMAQAEQLRIDANDCRGLVLGAEGWHPGVIGIVASRVVSRLNRPTVMVSFAEQQGHGSGRSIPGFHLAKALDACREHLESCGGHEMAAGLRLQVSRFNDFREAFGAYARTAVSEEMLIPELRLDSLAELRQISEAVVEDLHRLGPFGTGNRRPLLCCRDLEVAGEPRRVGRGGEHIQVLVRQGNVSMKCIAFNCGEMAEHFHSGARIDLAVEPTINEFNGSRRVELEIKDVRAAGT